MSTTTLLPARRRRSSGRASTALAALICALMLFPLYWMVNVSLTRPEDLIANPPHVFPSRPTLAGYELAFQTQLPNLVTSIAKLAVKTPNVE